MENKTKKYSLPPHPEGRDFSEQNPMNKLYLLTSFICGAIVMIIEIVGTKILSPFFGSGLFVWSSTITVAMLALSVGYFIGGKNADKIEKLNDHLYKLLITLIE